MMTRRSRHAFRRAPKTRVFWYTSVDGYDGETVSSNTPGLGSGRYGVLAVVPKDVAGATSLAAASQAPQNDICKIHAIRGQVSFGNLATAGAVATGYYRFCIYTDEVVQGETQGGATLPATSVGGFSQILSLQNSTRDIMFLAQGYIGNLLNSQPVSTGDPRTVEVHVKTKRLLKQNHALFFAAELTPNIGAPTVFQTNINLRTLLSVRR